MFPQRYNVTAGKDTDTLDVKVVGTGTERAIALRQPDAALATVVENRVLSKGGDSEKRHIGKRLSLNCSIGLLALTAPPEFELPPNMGYSAGDYLAVCVGRATLYPDYTDSISSVPTNPPSSVRRVIAHFGLSQEVCIPSPLSFLCIQV